MVEPDPRRRQEAFDALIDRAVEAEQQTGHREETAVAAKRHILVRIARITLGVAVLVLGILMLALPGPGLLVVALGLGLLAADVPFAARLLARVRQRLPQDEDGKLPTRVVVMMVLVCIVAVGASIGLWIYQVMGD